MKKRVLIISDSLGLPRSSPEFLLFEDTYFFKLKEAYNDYEFFPFMLGGGDLPTLYNYFKSYYIHFQPDIVIIQSGIVDCAPRAFTRREYRIINGVPIFRWVYNSRLKNRIKQIAKNRGKTNTSLADFSRYVDLFLSFNKGVKVYWNSILPASDDYEAYLPGIKSNISEYNAEIRKRVKDNFISYADMPFSAIMSDFHHMNREGHEFFFNRISEVVFKR